MDCPICYEDVIAQGSLILKYFSTATNSSCCWYSLERGAENYDVLVSSDREEVIAVYCEERLVFLNKTFLCTPALVKNA